MHCPGAKFQTSLLKLEGDPATSSKNIQCRVHVSDTLTPQADYFLVVYSECIYQSTMSDYVLFNKPRRYNNNITSLNVTHVLTIGH